MSKRLTSLFSISFSYEIFPNILRTSKITPIHKKDSKLKYSQLSNLDTILKRIMYNGLYTFLEKNLLFTVWAQTKTFYRSCIEKNKTHLNDSVGPNILVTKLENGIRGISNK